MNLSWTPFGAVLGHSLDVPALDYLTLEFWRFLYMSYDENLYIGLEKCHDLHYAIHWLFDELLWLKPD